MAISLPNGATLSIASAYGTATAVSGITNATEAVATVASATNLTVGGIVEITSGWSKLNLRLARIKTVTGTAITLEAIDTTNLIKFPAGSGIGSLRPITTWTQLTQVLEFSTSGGDQNYTNYSFLEDPTERQIPTNKSAQSISVTLGDDVTLPWYSVLDKADDDKLPRGLRLSLPSGSNIFYDTIASFNKTPTVTKNEVMGLAASFSLTADTTRYAS